LLAELYVFFEHGIIVANRPVRVTEPKHATFSGRDTTCGTGNGDYLFGREVLLFSFRDVKLRHFAKTIEYDTT
jgi:hypothetical protein